MSDANVISSPDSIEQIRWMVILRGIKLEMDTGMRHSSNAPKNAARALLTEAGKPVPRTTATLYHAFKKLYDTTYPPKGA